MTGMNTFTVTAKVTKVIALKGNVTMFDCEEDKPNGLRFGVVAPAPEFKLREGAILVMQGMLTVEEEDGSLTLAATSLAEVFTNDLRNLLNQSFREKQAAHASGPSTATQSTPPPPPSAVASESRVQRPEETPTPPPEEKRSVPVVESTPPPQNTVVIPDPQPTIESKPSEMVVESPDFVVSDEAPPVSENLETPPPEGYVPNFFNFDPANVAHRFEGTGGTEFKKI